MCGAEGADDTVCLDLCSGYEAFIDEDEYTYRYYTVRFCRKDKTPNKKTWINLPDMIIYLMCSLQPR